MRNAKYRQQYRHRNDVVLVSLLLLLDILHFTHCPNVSIADYEQVPDRDRGRGDTFARCYNKLKPSLDSTKIYLQIPISKNLLCKLIDRFLYNTSFC